MNDIVLFGCGGHSSSVADVILHNDPLEKLVFVDVNARAGETIFGFGVLSDIRLEPATRCFVSIGGNAARRNKYLELGAANIISIVSSLAYIGKDVTIGRGVFVAHSCHLGPGARVGETRSSTPAV